jgi:hypothetical protein
MSQIETSPNPPVKTGFVNMAKKILRWAIAVIVLIVISIIYVKYFYTYSEGYRAGLLQKFSHKGAIFKTYEGEMILSSISSTRDVAIASDKFLFSVVNKSLIRQFDTLQGQSVIVHYRQKNAPLFWHGDSPYLVDSVKAKR